MMFRSNKSPSYLLVSCRASARLPFLAVARVAADLQVGAFYFFRGAFMSDSRSINRSMFWRVLRRSVFANSGRLFVILLALGAGAAVTAALLNLQIDAKRRITTEFRSFGSNVIIRPRGDG